VDVFFAGQLQFPGGIIAQFDCSFVTPFIARMEITGTQGKITVLVPYKPGMREMILLERGGQVQQIRVKGIHLYSGEVEDIEDAILLGKPPRISLEDSLGNIAAIDALIKSATQSISINL
jgi:predicted dehydrogenase